MSKIRSWFAASSVLLALRRLARWIPVAALVGAMAGTASAVLLVALEWATATREAHKWLIGLLPVAGLAVGWLYLRWGSAVERGNNLILDEIHAEVEQPQRTLPARMAPLILLGTVLTHLFGGSAGREGTALQMGASLADQLARPFRMTRRERRLLLMCGISAGFASVFGTPLAGAVFGMEVLGVGFIKADAIVPCVLAAFLGDLTTRAWGVHHTVYRVTEIPATFWSALLWVAIAGAVFGLAGAAFAKATHGMTAIFRRYLTWAPMRPFVGGALVAGAVGVMHSTKYIGLGIPTIVAAFGPRHDAQDWLLKFAFTVVTLGAGFKGGEVTPLFFIGATLGNALAYVLPLPSSLLAGMGFVAVFGGAAKTPLAAGLMAMELFGAEAGTYAFLACVIADLCSGKAGIYTAQRRGRPRHAPVLRRD